MSLTEKEFYQTIDQQAQAVFKDRGSSFLAYAYPLSSKEEFKGILKDLKKAHPKAAHHCFAYRLGPDEHQFRVSDDGEPSGTAGRPILAQIDSKGLTNVLVIVVRYFGGTLLGVPGLIHAYKTAASLVLQTVPVIRKPVESLFELQFDYSRQNEVEQLLRVSGARILEKDFQLFCRLVAAIPRNRLKEFSHRFTEHHWEGIDLQWK